MKTIKYRKVSHSGIRQNLLATLAWCLIVFTSCEDFVRIDPPKTEIARMTIYSDDVAAMSAIRGIYSEMASIHAFSSDTRSIALFAGTSADEFVDLSGTIDRSQFYLNSLTPTNSHLLNYLWGNIYQFIYYSNAMLEGLASSDGISSPAKLQLEGEAKFVRAFSYFYLTNLFGDVPLITITDYRDNARASRTSATEIFQQIISDLNDAKSLLPADYSHAKAERVRPNKWAAAALLARVYLYTKDWNNAETEATEVINNTALYSLETDLNGVFLANSKEAIWQLMPVEPGSNTNEGNTFKPFPDGTNNIVALTEDLVDSFEPGDDRRTKWIDSLSFSSTLYYYPFKYKIQGQGFPLTEYSMVLRLAEQYLIRAEARAMQNKISEAISDLDVIRQRAGLTLLQVANPSISQPDLLLAIEQERRIEFFSEWGHRWLDLKRTNRADAVLSTKKSDWETTDTLFPIPQSERNNNTNLTQNSGY